VRDREIAAVLLGGRRGVAELWRRRLQSLLCLRFALPPPPLWVVRKLHVCLERQTYVCLCVGKRGRENLTCNFGCAVALVCVCFVVSFFLFILFGLLFAINWNVCVCVCVCVCVSDREREANTECFSCMKRDDQNPSVKDSDMKR